MIYDICNSSMCRVVNTDKYSERFSACFQNNSVTDPCTLSVDNCLLYSVCQSNLLLASQPQRHAATLLDVKVLSVNTLEISGSKM